MEAELQLIVAIRSAAVAGVGNLGIEGVVAGARHRDEVGAGGEVEPDEGIASKRIVVTGDDLPAAGCRILPVEREQAVEFARVVKRLARPGDDRFGGEFPGVGERKLEHVQVRAVGRVVLRQLLDVVVARKNRLS